MFVASFAERLSACIFIRICFSSAHIFVLPHNKSVLLCLSIQYACSSLRLSAFILCNIFCSSEKRGISGLYTFGVFHNGAFDGAYAHIVGITLSCFLQKKASALQKASGVFGIKLLFLYTGLLSGNSNKFINFIGYSYLE